VTITVFGDTAGGSGTSSSAAKVKMATKQTTSTLEVSTLFGPRVPEARSHLYRGVILFSADCCSGSGVAVLDHWNDRVKQDAS
jgi:hypothetical protein